MTEGSEDAAARAQKAAEVARRLTAQLQAATRTRLDVADQIVPLDWQHRAGSGNRNED